MAIGSITLFLCGDVMLGRGVDQILPHPGDPALRERYLRDARDYIGLAEQVSCCATPAERCAWPRPGPPRSLRPAGPTRPPGGAAAGYAARSTT